MVEPTDPMARLSYPFAELLRSIAGTAAPVLFMPRAVSLRRGPVVAVTRGSDRPARSLAAALGEPLVSLVGPEESPPLGREAVSRSLAPLHEHLLVFDRPSLAAMEPLLFAELAAERRVPRWSSARPRPRPDRDPSCPLFEGSRGIRARCTSAPERPRNR